MRRYTLTFFVFLLFFSSCNVQEKGLFNSKESSNDIDKQIDELEFWIPDSHLIKRPISSSEIVFKNKDIIKEPSLICVSKDVIYLFDKYNNILVFYECKKPEHLNVYHKFNKNEIIYHIDTIENKGLLLSGRYNVYVFDKKGLIKYANIHNIMKFSYLNGKIYFVNDNSGVVKSDKLIKVCNIKGNYIMDIGDDMFKFSNKSDYVQFLNLTICNNKMFIGNLISSEIVILDLLSNNTKSTEIDNSSIKLISTNNKIRTRSSVSNKIARYKTILRSIDIMNGNIIALYSARKRNYLLEIGPKRNILTAYELLNRAFIVDYCVSKSIDRNVVNIITKRKNKYSLWKYEYEKINYEKEVICKDLLEK